MKNSNVLVASEESQIAAGDQAERPLWREAPVESIGRARSDCNLVFALFCRLTFQSAERGFYNLPNCPMIAFFYQSGDCIVD